MPSRVPAAEGAEVTEWLGDPALLDGAVIGVLSSVRIPPELVLPALDVTIGLGERGLVILGGFQTPLERAVRDLLLRRRHRMVIALPRSLDAFRIPREWTEGIEKGRLLLIAASAERRITRITAAFRNQLIADVAGGLFVVHATPTGRAWRVVSAALARGKRVWCCAHPANLELEILGATPVDDVTGIVTPADKEGETPGVITAPTHPNRSGA